MTYRKDFYFLYLTTFFSGAAALITETVWLRLFSIILGSTVKASGVTFATFILGLAIGAEVLGRLESKIKRKAWAYSLLELGIAGSALLISLLLFSYRYSILIFLGDYRGVNSIVGIFITVLLFVFLPTFLMGGTFPVLMGIARKREDNNSFIGHLYGMNTIGAAFGTLFCSYIALRYFGVIHSIYLASSFNLIAFLSCLPLIKNEPKTQTAATTFSGFSMTSSEYAGILPEKILLSISFFSGFIIFSAEVIWLRFSSFYLGNRIFALANLLASFLLLLGITSWFVPKLLQRFQKKEEILLGRILLVSIFGLLLSSWLSHKLLLGQFALEDFLPKFKNSIFTYRSLQAFLVMVPMLLTLGCLFPLSLSLSHRTSRTIGVAAGRFYLINTLGAVLGSMLTGFWFIKVLGSFSTVRLLIVLLIFITFIYHFKYHRQQTINKIVSLTLGASFLLMILVIPRGLVVLKDGESLVYRAEDEFGLFQIARKEDGVLSVRNNGTELIYLLGRRITDYVQQMQAHLAMFYHPKAKSVLVLGGGYGITVGVYQLYPEMKEVTVVEILPSMITTADLYKDYNFSYYKQEKVNIVLDDARHYLARSKKKFDIITFNISDPHLPGSSGFYHIDFYEVAKRHLNENGILLIHGAGRDFNMILQTIDASFKHYVLYKAYGNSFNILASDRPLRLNPSDFDRFMRVPAVREALNRIDVKALRDLTGPVSRDSFSDLLTGDKILSDNYPRLEFSIDDDLEFALFSNE